MTDVNKKWADREQQLEKERIASYDLVKTTDTMEEAYQKYIKYGNMGIHPHTGAKLSDKEAKKFIYAANMGTLFDVAGLVGGAYYGQKAVDADFYRINNKFNGSKVKVPEQSLNHADVGDFTINPSTGKISKMKGGGHGQANIDFLKENGLEVNIEKTYPNGVRTGNVPDHKVKVKRTGNNQSWFPENWSSKDIERAGQHVASQPNFASAKDGEVIFGEYNGVRVGVIKNSGEPATIFPDATKQP